MFGEMVEGTCHHPSTLLLRLSRRM